MCKGPKTSAVREGKVPPIEKSDQSDDNIDKIIVYAVY
jgi:hypothetical protein